MSWRNALIMVAAVIVIHPLIAFAPEASASSGEFQRDVKFRAMSDEMDRSLARLRLTGHDTPYFIRYSLWENVDFSVQASLGALSSRSTDRDRTLSVAVRIGDYKFDNSNFSLASSGGNEESPEVPLDDDYLALRRSFWLLTDSEYKRAVSQLEAKKAFFLEQNMTLDDRLDDFSRCPAEKLEQDAEAVEIDQERWVEKVRKLSSVFREYPQIRHSWVRYDERVINSWLVNSEGSRVRTTERSVRVISRANIHAEDGSIITDVRVFLVKDRNDLPSVDEMAGELRKFAELLTRLAEARKGSYYEGPVLFEDQAAGQFFAQALAPYLAAPRKIHSNTSYSTLQGGKDKLARKMGRRVMPSFISVVDDPFARKFRGKTLFGGYDVDEQGVKPEKLVLIDRGFLKTLVNGRTPTKYVRRSNGHGEVGTDASKNSVLFIESSRRLSRKKIRKELKKLCRAEGLDYGLIVRRMTDPSAYKGMFETISSESDYTEPGSVSLSEPLAVYRIDWRTGKEELVRNLAFEEVTLRVLRDIRATGNVVNAYPVENVSNDYFHVVTPDILVSYLELKRKTSTAKKPLIPSPLKTEK